MPAKLTAAETLRFAGKPMQASRAEPSKMTSSSSIAQRSMPFLTTWGAPSSAAGPLRDSMTTRSMRPDGGGLDAVQPDDGAGGHEEAAAGLPRPVEQLRVGDERADADDHGALARGERGLDEAGHDGRARSLDEQVGLLDQFARAHVRRGRAERAEEVAGAGLGAARDACDLHAAERAVVSGAQDGPADRAASDDADGGSGHGYFSLPSSSQAT